MACSMNLDLLTLGKSRRKGKQQKSMTTIFTHPSLSWLTSLIPQNVSRFNHPKARVGCHPRRWVASLKSNVRNRIGLRMHQGCWPGCQTWWFCQTSGRSMKPGKIIEKQRCVLFVAFCCWVVFSVLHSEHICNLMPFKWHSWSMGPAMVSLLYKGMSTSRGSAWRLSAGWALRPVKWVWRVEISGFISLGCLMSRPWFLVFFFPPLLDHCWKGFQFHKSRGVYIFLTVLDLQTC